MLDGAARVGDLVAEVARQEMPAIAMTDHGNVFGAFDFFNQANRLSELKLMLHRNLVLKKSACSGLMVVKMMFQVVVRTHT